MFSTKKHVFTKTYIFSKKTHVFTKKIRSNGFKKINKVNKRKVMVLTFGLVFFSVTQFLPVSSSFVTFSTFFIQLILQI